MSFIRLRVWIRFSALSLVLLQTDRALAATLRPPTADGAFIPEVACPGPETPGGTKLKPLAALDLTPEQEQEIQGEIAGEFSGNWSYQKAAPLVGNIQINEYKAVDQHGTAGCVHAAIMIATPLVNVPAGRTLGWISIYKETGDAVKGDGGWTLDPPPERWIDQNNDGVKDPNEISDTAPFYYGSGEDPGYFTDGPHESHPEPSAWNGGITFYTYLVSWDGSFDSDTPHTIFVHDGFSWGFDGFCNVPEPNTLFIALPLLMLWLERCSAREAMSPTNRRIDGSRHARG
jgi:hypothetical protein